MEKCPNPACGQPIQPQWAFCVHCSKRLREGSAPTGVMYADPLAAETRVQAMVPECPASAQMTRANGGMPHPLAPRLTALPTRATRVAFPPKPVAVMGEEKVQVIDLSTSMLHAIELGFLNLVTKKTKLDAVRTGLTGAINAAIAQADDSRMAIIGYSDAANVICNLTSVRESSGNLLSAAERLAAYGHTNIGAGLSMAKQILDGAGSKRRKRITLFSDGFDNASSNPVAIALQIKEQGIFIETIGFGKTRQDVDESTMKAIASIANGKPQYRFFSEPADLIEAMTQTGQTRVY